MITWTLLIVWIGCDRPAEEPAGPSREEREAPPAPLPLPLEAAALQTQRDHLATLALWDAEGAAPPNVDPAIWALTVPDDNATTAARVALGRRLYFDNRLSADGTVACATCHDSTRSFVDFRNASEGIGQQVGRRNAPTTMNAALLESQFWDGRAATLEQQAGMPILNSIEMGQPSREAAVGAIASDAEYARMFEEAYGRGVNYGDIERAIAAFERTLIFLDAPFDRFVRGDTSAMSEAARAGWVLFNGHGRCMTCHPVSPANPLFSDSRFHNIGVAARHRDFDVQARHADAALALDDSEEAIDELVLATDASELGRFVVSRQHADLGAFRTPQLRNVGITAPYMHDGSMATLFDVMDHYNKGGEPNAYLDGAMVPLALSEEELEQLVAFCFALTDDRFRAQNEAELARQRAIAARRRPFRDDALAFRRALAFEPDGGVQTGGE